MLPALLLAVAIPAVSLSEGHQAMTLVNVGEAFPEIQGVAEARGAKATVVAVPGGAPWMAAMLTGDLKNDFAPKYADRGVALMTLAGPEVADNIHALNVDAVTLRQSLGKGRMPRVYVLDATGKIVWFDLEYTLSTHRELHATLEELAGE